MHVVQVNGANGPSAFKLRGGELMMYFTVLQPFIVVIVVWLHPVNILTSLYDAGFIVV